MIYWIKREIHRLNVFSLRIFLLSGLDNRT
jgi:hypothetical protein